MDHFLKVRGENKQYLKPPPVFLRAMVGSSSSSIQGPESCWFCIGWLNQRITKCMQQVLRFFGNNGEEILLHIYIYKSYIYIFFFCFSDVLMSCWFSLHIPTRVGMLSLSHLCWGWLIFRAASPETPPSKCATPLPNGPPYGTGGACGAQGCLQALSNEKNCLYRYDIQFQQVGPAYKQQRLCHDLPTSTWNSKVAPPIHTYNQHLQSRRT